MFALDVVSDKKPDDESTENKTTLYAISITDKLNLHSTFKSTKQCFLDLLVEMQKHEARFAKTSNKFYRRGAKKVMINPVALKHFVYYCRSLKLADKQLCIDPSPIYQVSMVFLISRFLEYFYRNLQKVGPKVEQVWEQQLCALGFSKHDAQIYTSIQLLNSNRLHVYKVRDKAEKVCRNQKFMRKEAIERDKAAKLPELLPWDPNDMQNLERELMRTELLDMDDACLIIQCIERMYQAIGRGIYLFEVRKKAMNLHNDDASDIEPTKAIIKIQAITRGFLARKRVKEMRDRERSKLGMDIESLLDKRAAARQRRVEYPPSSPYLLKYQQLVHIEMPTDLKLPKTFVTLMEQLQPKLYLIDPLDSLGKNKTTNDNQFTTDRETESILSRLITAEIATLGRNDNSKKVDVTFDELISYTVSVQIGAEIFFFDLRNFLYLTVVFPHVLCSWPKLYFKRQSLLITGNQNSGRHAWTRSLALKGLWFFFSIVF